VSLFELRSHQQQSQQELESLRATIETLQTQMRKTRAPSRPAEDEGEGNSEAITSLARAAAQEEARRMMQQQPQQRPLEPGEEPSEQPPQAKRPPPVSYEQSQALVLAACSGEAEDAEWSRDASRRLNTLLHSRLPGGSRAAPSSSRERSRSMASSSSRSSRHARAWSSHWGPGSREATVAPAGAFPEVTSRGKGMETQAVG
jgi:hypothetical protein